MKLLLFGYGNVGKAFRKLLHEKRAPELNEVTIGGIVTRRGIMLQDKEDFKPDIEGDVFKAYEKIKPDVIVDVSSANYNDGEPSLSLYKDAIKDGVHVITTNKAPLALAFDEIFSLAKSKGVKIGFQGTVMSGTPSINLYRVLPGSRVIKIRGILNGTTNFILTLMNKGVSFEEALKEAQRRGYAEEDPTLDINGFDAAAKITILANFMIGKKVTIKDIKFEGINRDLPKNEKIKLIAYADEKEVWVKPLSLSQDDPLYNVDGVENALEITTDIQAILIRGPGAGPVNAAYGALSDLILLKRNCL
ncbi:homoserine dehydrogenase [Sulfolobus sp. S-194]|uniref:homoserine dehydrogenase n=1 Tax=Sulfolobus sp. S-194 TaxID=2512240 RepID=UPI00143701BB|nr:homoserine dehydrogenase [Sulfolobus sp. S-194]QIW24396.1 homoserine dehydrogenase [Sulfolobus sp. S-194]